MTKPNTTSPELITGSELLEEFERTTNEYVLLRKAEAAERNRRPALSPHLHTRVPVFESVEAIDDEMVLAFGREASIAATKDALAVQRIERMREEFHESLVEIREIMNRLVGKAVLISAVVGGAITHRPPSRSGDLLTESEAPSVVEGEIEGGGMNQMGGSSISVIGHVSFAINKHPRKYNVQPVGIGLGADPDSVSRLVTIEFQD